MIEWKGLFANTPYSSANNKTQDDAVVGMQDTIYVTGPGYGGYSANVRVHNESGAVVALIPVSGGGGALSAPAPVRILDDSTTYSYSLEVVRGDVPSDDADKIVIRIVGGASKRYPGQVSTLPDGSTSFAGAMRVEDGLVASTTGYIDLMAYSPILDGMTPIDAVLQTACDDADALGVPLALPGAPIVISRTLTANRLIGIPGKTRIIPAPGFVFAQDRGFVANRHFIASYDSAGNPPDYVEYTGLIIDWAPDQRNDNGYIRIANVKSGLIKDNYFAASSVLDSTSKPFVVGAFVDLWGPCKRVNICWNTMQMLTGGHGSNRVAAGGGGCIWIRCLQFSTDSTVIDARATELNNVYENDITHWSSDEAVAIYGVKGIARYNSIRNNRIYVPKSDTTATDPYHVTLISVFPLNDGSAPGAKAACYGNTVEGNKIIDYACFGAVIRTGNDTDASNPCYNNVTQNNEITLYRSTDAVNGQHAVWVALGGSGTDPDIGMFAYRVISGAIGVGYPGFWDGNVSIDDRVIGLNTPYLGWVGHCAVENPKCDGVGLGCLSVQDVIGGQIHVATIPFLNCQHVDGSRVRVDVANGPIFNVTQNSAVRYNFRNVHIGSSSRLLNVDAAVPAAAAIVVQGCVGSLGSIAAAVTNNAPAGTRVVVQDNEFAGMITAAASGAGTTVSRRNYWGGLVD